MKKKFFGTLTLVCACFMVCLAVVADLTGTWAGVLNLPQGAYPVSYNFKVDGDKLTGTANSDAGAIPLEKGKITGTTFAFSIDFNGTEIKHTGKYYADSVVIDLDFKGQSAHSVLKRVEKK